tara:strand:- start:565 stop:1197 length:633 start_codon:yes stop_codon:yes gene_type:complete
MKYLIINADDFGMSKKFNEAILDLIKSGKVKSTTVMVNRITEDQGDQVKELIKLSNSMNLSVGLHLEFEDSNYEEETKIQHEKFIKIFKFNPSHVDIHRSRHFTGSVPLVAKFCIGKKLPCRNKGGDVEYFKTTDAPSFHGTTEEFSKIEDWIKTLEDSKSYEILFHPGFFDSDSKSSYNKIRELDIKHIIKLNSMLKKHDIKQISYLDL